MYVCMYVKGMCVCVCVCVWVVVFFPPSFLNFFFFFLSPFPPLLVFPLPRTGWRVKEAADAN